MGSYSRILLLNCHEQLASLDLKSFYQLEQYYYYSQSHLLQVKRRNLSRLLKQYCNHKPTAPISPKEEAHTHHTPTWRYATYTKDCALTKPCSYSIPRPATPYSMWRERLHSPLFFFSFPSILLSFFLPFFFIPFSSFKQDCSIIAMPNCQVVCPEPTDGVNKASLVTINLTSCTVCFLKKKKKKM